MSHLVLAYPSTQSAEMRALDNEEELSGDSGLEYSFGFQETEPMRRLARKQLDRAMDLLPAAEKAAYLEATKRCPGLVETESSPIRFLQFDNYNPWAAANRLAAYWRTRKEIFGERAFLPMDLTGKGALKEEDMSAFDNGAFSFLPNDRKSRSVVFFDRSKHYVTNRRIAFFLMQIQSEEEASVKDGPIVLLPVVNMTSTYNPQMAVFINSVLCGGMPVRSPKVHLICLPPPSCGRFVCSSLVDRIVALALNQLGPFMENCFVHVCSSKEDALQKLVKYNMVSEGLPQSLGGTLSREGFWEWQRKRGRVFVEQQPQKSQKLINLNSLVRESLAKFSAEKEAAQADRTAFESALIQGDSPTATFSPLSSAAPSRVAERHLKPSSPKTQLSLPNARDKTVEKPRKGRQTTVKPDCESSEWRTKKRKMDAIYARRKRERQRIEKEVLQDQHSKLVATNEELKAENKRLEDLLKVAKREVSRIQDNTVLVANAAGTSQNYSAAEGVVQGTSRQSSLDQRQVLQQTSHLFAIRQLPMPGEQVLHGKNAAPATSKALGSNLVLRGGAFHSPPSQVRQIEPNVSPLELYSSRPSHSLAAGNLGEAVAPSLVGGTCSAVLSSEFQPHAAQGNALTGANGSGIFPTSLPAQDSVNFQASPPADVSESWI